MALSDYEKEALDQIELGLRAGGLTVCARPLAGTRPGRRIVCTAIAAIAVGLTLVLTGLISKVIVVSVVGFSLIVAATMAMGSRPTLLWSRSKRTKIRR